MRRFKVIIVTALSVLMLSACTLGEAVELSDEDSKRVADYSSDILSQHNQYSNSRIVPVEEARMEYQKKINLEARKKNFIAIEQGLNQETSPEGDGSTENGEGSGEGEAIPVPEISLAEAIDIPEFDVSYAGFEVGVTYPATGSVSDDVVMGMTAAAGDSMIVLHFNVTNTAEYEQECDVLSGKPQFRVRVNGERKTLQQTILNNDLSKFQSVLQPGQTVDTVLICELSEAEANAAQTLSLIVRSAEGRPEYVLEE